MFRGSVCVHARTLTEMHFEVRLFVINPDLINLLARTPLSMQLRLNFHYRNMWFVSAVTGTNILTWDDRIRALRRNRPSRGVSHINLTAPAHAAFMSFEQCVSTLRRMQIFTRRWARVSNYRGSRRFISHANFATICKATLLIPLPPPRRYEQARSRNTLGNLYLMRRRISRSRVRI